jgi:hypothetical protein
MIIIHSILALFSFAKESNNLLSFAPRESRSYAKAGGKLCSSSHRLVSMLGQKKDAFVSQR